jgi:hydrogenase expression/formation protein HypC
MCLGIPGRIVEVGEVRGLRMAKVSFGGIEKAVCLEYLTDAKVGEWVLVHVGFALSRIDEAEARRIFEFLKEFGEMDELGSS